MLIQCTFDGGALLLPKSAAGHLSENLASRMFIGNPRREGTAFEGVPTTDGNQQRQSVHCPHVLQGGPYCWPDLYNMGKYERPWNLMKTGWLVKFEGPQFQGCAPFRI